MIPFDASGTFYPRAGSHELRRLAVRGAAATVSASGLALVAQLVSTVILARLLTPADFGVVAMVTTFSLLVASFGLNGFTEAVIQFEGVDHYTASNLFWLNSAAGVVLAIAFKAAGAMLVRFYGNPLVANVATGLSVGVFIAAVSVIHLALLKRGMRFAATSTNDVVGRVANTAVSILLALRGWGYWALVAGIISQQLSVTIGAWWLCRWVPSLPRRTGKTGAMVWFAAKVYGQFSVSYSMLNLDNLLVGWQFNAVALGFYKKAYDLFALSASQLTAPLNNVALASLSRLNQDHVRFRRYLANSLGIIAFVGMGMSANLTLAGKGVVRLVLGSQWSQSGRIFELFGPGIGVMLLCSTVGWIHLSVGKPERWLRWTVFQLAATACLFLLALPWGPEGVAAAWSISFWTLLIPGFWYAGRPIRFGLSALIAPTWRYVVAALVAGLITAAIIRGTPVWGTPSGTGAALEAIVIISALFVTLYLGAVILLHWGLAPLRQLTSLLRELTPLSKPAAEAVEEYK
ncbi:lipopolysaccharide biosynthesis protein [Alloacidobacterium dinghuense]|uniref:Lipopolysaccharide biosynthesis protein n=1 Tax=Alloacidobacterium dinghuense TaxID=2763107 RepID=A0A7G8BLS4_9BACT|nr:lipopolysaccharide biosynthesis protein [Alloacidobacterium dinghuense]QNI33494.1 lipopolysaccharide biosynthesis protein [Alloacidobacterium dinghuense]